MPGPFRRHHKYIDGGRRHDLTEMNIESVSECQVRAGLQIRGDLLPIDGGLGFIRSKDHNDISAFTASATGMTFSPLAPPFAMSPFSQPYHDVDPALLQIERMGMTLTAISDHGDRFIPN